MAVEIVTIARVPIKPALPTTQPKRKYMITPKIVNIEGVKTPPNVPNPVAWAAELESVGNGFVPEDDFTFTIDTQKLGLAYYYRSKTKVVITTSVLIRMKDLKNR